MKLFEYACEHCDGKWWVVSDDPIRRQNCPKCQLMADDRATGRVVFQWVEPAPGHLTYAEDGIGWMWEQW